MVDCIPVVAGHIPNNSQHGINPALGFPDQCANRPWLMSTGLSYEKNIRITRKIFPSFNDFKQQTWILSSLDKIIRLFVKISCTGLVTIIVIPGIRMFTTTLCTLAMLVYYLTHAHIPVLTPISTIDGHATTIGCISCFLSIIGYITTAAFRRMWRKRLGYQPRSAMVFFFMDKLLGMQSTIPLMDQIHPNPVAVGGRRKGRLRLVLVALCSSSELGQHESTVMIGVTLIVHDVWF